jgi:L-asparagine transporter-like permease
MIFTHFGYLEEIEIYTLPAYIIQISSSFYMVLFAVIIYLRHGGFSFVDHKSSKRKTLLLNKSNRTFFIGLVIAMILFILVNILYYNSEHPPYLVIALIFLLTLLSLLYLALRRDDNRV